MAYEPLHHKYRPQRFSEVVGQEPIVTTLTHAIQTGRIANAYLFTGSRGTGKTTTARLMAKALNCVTGPTPEPCGICELCRGITLGNALDVIEIDAASNTGVDNIRELIERAQFAPVQGRYKVYLVDEVHMLSSAAFNCLLKTLEEPPPRITFILATTDPQKVLPTVISRCQRFDFRRISLGAMVDHLGFISRKEKIEIDPEALELVAQIAQGGLRDAESLLDQLSLLDGTITVERVWQLVGAVPERELLALAQSIRTGESTVILERVRHLLDCGKESLQVLQDLTGFYRDLLIARTAPDRRDLVAVTALTWQQMTAHAREYSPEQILTLQERLRTAEPQLKGTTQPRLWLEVSLLGLTHSQTPTAAPTGALPPPQPAVQPLPVRLEPSQPLPSTPPPRPAPPVVEPTPPPQPERTPEPGVFRSLPGQLPPEPPRQTEPPVPAPATASMADQLRSRWEDFFKLLDPPNQGLMRNAFVLKGSGKEIVLGFSNDAFVKKAGEQKRVRNVQEALRQLLGFTGTVQMVRGMLPNKDNPPPGPPPTGPRAGSPSPSPPAPVSTGVPGVPPADLLPAPVLPGPPLPQVAILSGFSSSPPVDLPVAEPGRRTYEEPDELDRMTRSLAEFFNGEVISWDGERADPVIAAVLKPTVEEEEEEEDLPF